MILLTKNIASFDITWRVLVSTLAGNSLIVYLLDFSKETIDIKELSRPCCSRYVPYQQERVPPQCTLFSSPQHCPFVTVPLTPVPPSGNWIEELKSGGRWYFIAYQLGYPSKGCSQFYLPVMGLTYTPDQLSSLPSK